MKPMKYLWPDLSRFNCDKVTVVFHLGLGQDVIQRLMSHSHHHPTKGHPTKAYYGNIYTRNKIAHVAQGTVMLGKDNKTHIEIEFTRQRRSRPPSDIKPVGDLLGIVQESIQDVIADYACDATFTYRVMDGWRSRFPLPLPIRKPRNQPFTHIEGVKFSKRTNATIERSLEISISPDGDLRHITYLKGTVRFTLEMFRDAVKEASRLSRQSLIRSEEASRAN